MASAQTMAQGFKERATKGGTPKRLWPSTDNTQIEATWARLRLLFTQQLSAVHLKLVLSLDQMATKSDEMGSMLATQLEKLNQGPQSASPKSAQTTRSSRSSSSS
jgi:hypothetical protein